MHKFENQNIQKKRLAFCLYGKLIGQVDRFPDKCP